MNTIVRIDGKKIKQFREQQELTQLYVATVVGVTVDTISRWENKRYPGIKKGNCLKLAEALEVDLADLLESSPEEKKSPEILSKTEHSDFCVDLPKFIHRSPTI